MNKDLEQRYRSVIEDNVNVAKTNDGKEFLILITGLIIICLSIYYLAEGVSSIFIDNMSSQTQMKIEKALSITNYAYKSDKTIYHLEKIRDKIVSIDKNLQNKSNFPVYEYPSDEINAFIVPDGAIYFTTGLLKEVKDEEILTFIMAHELGHYAHRDHLKSISRQIIISFGTSIISGGNKDLSITTGSISEFSALKYSRKQEENADLYANNVVYKIYGRNDGAVRFFKYLEKKENIPEFLTYFSTHPSVKKRLKLLQKK